MVKVINKYKLKDLPEF